MGIYTKGGFINSVINDTSVTGGLYTRDSAMRVKVVSGSTFTGKMAGDGSVNVTTYDGFSGLYHPCGALRAFFVNTETGASGLYHASGALNLYTSVSNATLELIGESNGLSLNFLDNTSDIVTSGVSVKSTATGTITFSRASTATRVNSSGLIETVSTNTPRLDYNPATLAPRGLLVEEQRTNLFLRSAEFQTTSWTKVISTVTADQAVSPSGATDADAFIPNATSGLPYIFQNPAVTSGNTYSFSIYVKPAGFSWFFLDAFDGANHRTWFNVSTGTIGTVEAGNTSTITPVGNGWYRCTLTRVAGSNSVIYALAAVTGNNNLSITGNGVSGYYLWGAQLELGSFPTSYIPTTTATVTRSADVASVATSSFPYSATAGTLIVSADYIGQSPSVNYFTALDDGTTSNFMGIRRNPAGDTWLGVNVGGVNQVGIFNPVVVNNVVFKNAFAYKLNDYAVAANGTLTGTDTSATVPTVSKLNLGNLASSFFMNGHIRQITYIPRRLFNTELKARTTP